MLERKHGMFDDGSCDYRFDGVSGDGDTLRQYRTIGVCGLRSQIFRQMKQKTQGILCVFPRLFVKYAGKDASKTCASYLCGVALSEALKRHGCIC